MGKVSVKEQKITERIFNLHASLRMLDYGYFPMHEEAKKIIRDRIKELKQGNANDNPEFDRQNHSRKFKKKTKHYD